MPLEPAGPLYAYKAQVQAAQQAYSNIMAAAWKEVTAGRLPEPAYWRIADGNVLTETGALLAAAGRDYQAALS